MDFRRFLLLQVAITAVCCGHATAIACQGPNGDLFDPSLDQPLTQYRSTQAQSYEPLQSQPQPVQPSAPAIDSQIDARPLSSAGPVSNGGSVELAPNPLADMQRPNWTPSVSQPTKQPALRLPSEGTPFQPTEGRKSFSLSENPSKLKAKKPVPKKVAKKAKKKPAPLPRQPEVDYAIYRDLSPWPVDPRKPNNPCTQNGQCQCHQCQSNRTGLHGRPYQPQEPGGYRCGKNCPSKRPEFSVYWPKPLSVKREQHGSQCQCQKCNGGRKVNDLFDGLANFRLINYQRTDNGYCGPGADPYGCLGESKVMGVGYRIPSEPANYPLR